MFVTDCHYGRLLWGVGTVFKAWFGVPLVLWPFLRLLPTREPPSTTLVSTLLHEPGVTRHPRGPVHSTTVEDGPPSRSGTPCRRRTVSTTTPVCDPGSTDTRVVQVHVEVGGNAQWKCPEGRGRWKHTVECVVFPRPRRPGTPDPAGRPKVSGYETFFSAPRAL